MVIVALVTMALLPLSMSRHLHRCQASVVALDPFCQAGIVALVVIVPLPLMHRHLCCCFDCDCPPHDNGVIVFVDAQASLPSSSWRHCPRNNGVVALDPQLHCCLCWDGVVTVLKLVLLPSLQWHVMIINVVTLVACHQAGIIAFVMMALLPSMRRPLCHCHDGNCCSCHDGIVAVVNVQASLPLSS
jgi:hypothetical protein